MSDETPPEALAPTWVSLPQPTPQWVVNVRELANQPTLSERQAAEWMASQVDAKRRQEMRPAMTDSERETPEQEIAALRRILLRRRGEGAEMDARTVRALQLLGIVEAWIAKREVSCAESLVQMDSINESLPELAEAVCNVAGWHRYPDEDAQTAAPEEGR